METSSDTEIRLLGPLTVLQRRRELDLPKSRKARALLAMLALEPGDHPRSQLCTMIWPDTADPRADLRWALSKLRGVLDAEAIIGTAATVRLDESRVTVDVLRLQSLLAEPDAVATDQLQRYAREASVEPLEGLDARIGTDFELWLESKRQMLRRLQQRLLSCLMERLGDSPEDALIMARQRLAIDPLNESSNVALLRLTMAIGGRQRAQADLEQARRRLQQAGLSDASLLAAWRVLSAQPAAPSTVDPAVDDPLPGVSPGTAPAPQVLHEAVPETEELRGLPDKPSVAVLGFEDVTGEDPLLSEGLAVDLTAKLCRLKGLFVIARASARRFTLGTQGAEAIGQRLGVRYLIHGSLQRRGNRLRVSAELVECDGSGTLWAERFERSTDDLFQVQDEIVGAIVASLEPQIQTAEMDRSRLLPAGDMHAWECFHRALWHSYRFTQADVEQADHWLHRALKLDPNFARAHAGLSFNYFSKVFLLASDDPAGDVARALASASESVALEPRDAFGHWSLARAQFLSRSHDAALSSIDRALVTNPNYAQGYYARGYIGVHSGVANLVVGDLDVAQRLSPFDPMRFAVESARAIALTETGDDQQAVRWAQQAVNEPNAHFHIHAIAAGCQQLVGQTESAALRVAELLRRRPDYSIAAFVSSFPARTERELQRLRSAMRDAGIPTGDQ